MSVLANIKRLTLCLSHKDYRVAVDLISARDFESLYELVDSAIKITVKDRRKEEEDQKYREVDLEGVNQLKGEIAVYLEQLKIPDEKEYYLSDSYQESELDFYD